VNDGAIVTDLARRFAAVGDWVWGYPTIRPARKVGAR